MLCCGNIGSGKDPDTIAGPIRRCHDSREFVTHRENRQEMRPRCQFFCQDFPFTTLCFVPVQLLVIDETVLGRKPWCKIIGPPANGLGLRRLKGLRI